MSDMTPLSETDADFADDFIPDTGAGTRKPRLAIMGEFSAGKSTLSNLLLGARPLPEKVTATRLPPVWITDGDEAPYRITLDGDREDISLADIQDVPVEETRVVRLSLHAEILQYCDLIDFPGISDPNMDSVVWERVLEEMDMVLWCTHATQAWRQSEAAVWEAVPAAVRARSLLLITRFDKLTTDRDRARVLHRVTSETEGLFRAVFPISMTQAIAATGDAEAWEASGAAAFADHLLPLLEDIADGLDRHAEAQDTAGEEPTKAEFSKVSMGDPGETPAVSHLRPSPPAPEAPRIVPRRVRPQGSGSRPRPAG